MKQNYRIETEEFTMINNKPDTYSCFVPYKKEEPMRELTYEPIKVREWDNAAYNYETGILTIKEGDVSTTMHVPIGKYKGECGTSEDWGPQRFCPECHTKLMEDEEGDRVLTRYYNPELEIYEGEYFADEKHWWCPKCREEILEPLYRSEDPEDWDRYNWKKAYTEAYDSMSIWMMEEVDKIMKEHHDKAGESELEVKEVSYEDMDGNIIDPVYNSDKGLADADSEIFDLTELSKQEIYIINYLTGDKGSNFRYNRKTGKWYKTNSSGVLLYNQYKCLQKLYAAYNKGGIRKHVMEHLLGCIFACYGVFHPNRDRYLKYKDLQTWEQIQESINRDEAWVKQDWELEDRVMKAQHQRVYWY